MFVRTNASRQNFRLGRSISRLTYLPSSPPSSYSSFSFSSASSFSPLALSGLSSTRRQSRPWHRPTLPVASRENTSYLTERSFASAVADLPISTANPDLVKLYNLRHFDPTNATDLAVIHDMPRAPPNGKGDMYGVSGEPEVAISVFEACLRVGHLDRAAIVLRRIMNVQGLESEQLIDLNNLYLEAWVRRLKVDPGVGKAEELHAWYEQHVHSARLPQTSETIAYMLKASLLTTQETGTRLTRLISRYMDMVPRDQGLDVLYCTDILTDTDIAAITKLYPEFNVADYEGEFYEEFAVDEALPDGTDIADTLPDTTHASNDGSRVPDVLETSQKGIGLQTIQNTLGIFRHMKDGYDISLLPYQERREFQSRLERDCINAALDRWREMDENMRAMGISTSLKSTKMKARLWIWHQDLEKHFQHEFELIKEAMSSDGKKTGQDTERCTYGPMLMLSTPSRLAAVTMLAVLNNVAYSGISVGNPLSSILNTTARAVEDDIMLMRREEAQKEEKRKNKMAWMLEQQRKAQGLVDGHHKGAGDRHAVYGDRGHGGDEAVPTLATVASTKHQHRPWPLSLRTKIAAVLLSGLVEVSKVKVFREHSKTKEKVVSMQPAFTHCTQLRKGRKVGVLVAHPTLAEEMRKEPRADFLARHLPMVVRPDPWSKTDRGAYVDSPVNLMRVRPGERDQKLYAEAALARGDLDQVMKGLDVLGKTAWRINRPVFDVFLEAWNTGDAIAKVPPLDPDIAIPEEPEISEGSEARRSWLKALKQAHNLKMSYHSTRCFMNFQLEIARAFRDQEFFVPHNIDFRGRAYPIPPYLNHMGADHVRGLLRFSKGKELGERGFMWLKVHLANVYGFDKASLTDRAAFAETNIHHVIDSATKPLRGQRWWLKAEDPWQCLAACFELKAALDLPDPTKYVSSLPVHQDGTCNGLQHYAALGGDKWGAEQVNLTPGDKPADVYTAVADLVRKGLEEEASRGHPVAKIMKDKIKRKIVKQTVMTNVYGVTFQGARKQVAKQITAHYPRLEEEHNINPAACASYIAHHIFTALATMFKGAHDIQFWLGEIGGRVCRALTAEQLIQVAKDDTEPASGYHKAKTIVTEQDLLSLCRSTIIWTTPLRMPVVQPYRKSISRNVVTCMQYVALRSPSQADPVDRRKQLQAFPPNFIHSLDATHMLLSALQCDELGLTFAAVHDSFWTHAADVDVMNRVLRDAFIRIHSEDVIKRLAVEFETRYKGGLYLANVESSSRAGQEIRKWRMAQRPKRADRINGREEILMEKKRMDLLNSDDPVQRQEGEEMVTAASIYAKYAPTAEASIVREDLSATALGSLSDETASVSASADHEDDVDVATPDDDMGHGGDLDVTPQVPETAEPEASEATESPVNDLSNENFASFQSSLFEEVFKGTVRKKKRKPSAIRVWLPLSFPDVPAKGGFDVSSLRDSDYFFS